MPGPGADASRCAPTTTTCSGRRRGLAMTLLCRTGLERTSVLHAASVPCEPFARRWRARRRRERCERRDRSGRRVVTLGRRRRTRASRPGLPSLKRMRGRAGCRGVGSLDGELARPRCMERDGAGGMPAKSEGSQPLVTCSAPRWRQRPGRPPTAGGVTSPDAGVDRRPRTHRRRARRDPGVASFESAPAPGPVARLDGSPRGKPYV